MSHYASRQPCAGPTATGLLSSRAPAQLAWRQDRCPIHLSQVSLDLEEPSFLPFDFETSSASQRAPVLRQRTS